MVAIVGNGCRRDRWEAIPTIGFATADMIPALTALWRACFQDKETYIAFVFAQRFRPEQVLVDVREGTPVGMLWLLPAELCRAEQQMVPVWYVYAVATAVEWRGQGISTALLSKAAELAREQGISQLLLAPATPELFGFYKARGYHTVFQMRYERFSVEEPTAEELAVKLTPVSPRMYQRLRDQAFLRPGYVRWDEAAIAYVLRENRQLEGVSCMIESTAGKHLALCVRIGETLIVKETTLPDAALRACLSKIARKLACTSVTVRLAPNGGASDQAFAMAGSPEDFAAGYLNLALD